MSLMSSSKSHKNKKEAAADDQEEEDDYMTMALPTTSTKETSFQRLARQKAAREARAHPKSKKQLAADAAATREAGLDTALDASNKGFQMMRKLGFKGGALGRDGDAGASEPIRVRVREGRSGIGAATAAEAQDEGTRKRKASTGADGGNGATTPVSEGDFMARVAGEQRAAHIERALVAAMRVARRLDEEDADAAVPTAAARVAPKANVLWRRLVVEEREGEGEREAKRARRFLFRAADEEEFDAYERDGESDADDDGEDEELAKHLELSSEEQLKRLLQYLRTRFRYCFYCKTTFPDETMDGCPGLTEEDHD